MKTENKKHKNKGITLIALIITIILMLILAGIVLNLTIGENKLFDMVKYAERKWNNSQEQEQRDLDELYSSILIAGDSKVTLTMQELDKYIDKKVNEKISNITVNGTYETIFEGTAGAGTHDLNKDINDYKYLIVYAKTPMGVETSLIVDRESYNSPRLGIDTHSHIANYFYIEFAFTNDQKIKVTHAQQTAWGGAPYIYLIKGVR